MPASLLLTAAAALAAPTVPVSPKVAEQEAPASHAAAPLENVGRASIGFLSAAALRERCESTSAGLVSYCFAYVVGVHDTVQAYETWLRVREFCAPPVSSQSDMRRAFIRYLDKNPGAGSGEAASVIVLALKDEFACAAGEGAKAMGESAAKQPPATGMAPKGRRN